MARVVLAASYTRSLINFRGDMIKNWLEMGHEVYTCAPETGYEEQIRALGASFTPVRLKRTGLNPINDAIYFYDLVRLFRKTKPDIVFSYTIKPVIYGSLAASLCSVPGIFSMITGAGYAFEDGRNPLLKKVLHGLYRTALSKNNAVIFQNPDNVALFKGLKLLGEDQQVHMVNGSGVNVEKYQFSQPPKEPFRFLLIGRLIPEKGIREYAEAAKEVKKLCGNKVSFGLLGPLEKRLGSISEEEVAKWQQEGIIEYYGATDDIRPYMQETTVYVLPSYHEGTPRTVLEALAMGRPVITTDAPGCRETVIDGENGFLVPVRDVPSLAKAMLRFLENPDLVHAMGAAGRKIAETKYDVRKVNEDIARILGL